MQPSSHPKPAPQDGATEPFRAPTVPAPERPLPPVAFLARMIRNPLGCWPRAVYEQPIFRQRVLGRNLAFVTGPDLVQTVLQTTYETFVKGRLYRRVLGPLLGEGLLIAEGLPWRWQRRAAAPVFRPAELQAFVPLMAAAAERTIDRWSAADGPVRNVDDDMMRATFEVIVEAMIARHPGFDTDAISRAVTEYLRPSTWAMTWEIAGLPLWLPFPGRRRMRSAADFLRSTVRRVVEERRQSGEREEDLLQRLLAASDPETRRPMGDEQLVDNLLTFLMAGHETTANALSWTLYLLAHAPVWQERLRREIGEVVGEGPVTGAHLQRLTLVEQVVKESMRLYPPAPILPRIVAQPTVLDGIELAICDQVFIPIYAVHRHRRLWKDPEVFDPSRFEPAREAARSRFAYMPFGAGPRVCIGASFAMIEATTVLAVLVRRARFFPVEGFVPVPVMRVTLRSPGGMPVEVRVA